MSSRGTTFIMSAPSGAGKTTLVEMLKREFPNVVSSISCTTRAPRAGEVDGLQYHFLTKDEFQEKVDKNEFIEHVDLFNASYGTLKKDLEKDLAAGKHVVLTIDVQGAENLMGTIAAVYIFIMPPSLAALKERMEKRNTESEDSIEVRLARAQAEIEAANGYDYIIVNDDLNAAYHVLKSIVIAEEHRVKV